MAYAGGAAGGSAAAAAAALANATKASGAIIKVNPENFQKIIGKSEPCVVVIAKGGIFKKHYQYITNYRGFFFYTKSSQVMSFSSGVEIVYADKIWIPS